MSANEWRGRLLAASAILISALLGVALVYDHLKDDSPTMDEPFHALASAEYVMRGTYYANLEHPPLAKILAGFSLRSAGVRPPRMETPFSMATAEQPGMFSHTNVVPHRKLFAAARRPFPLFFLLLVPVAAAISWRLAGPVAAVATAGLLSFEPTLVAHAGFLHTDVPATLLLLVTLWMAIASVRTASLSSWALTGVLLGLSFATKFSAVLVVPSLILVALVGLLVDRRAGGNSLKPLGGLLLCGAVSLAVLLGVYSYAMRSMPADQAEVAVRLFLRSRFVPPPDIERHVAISRVCPPLGHYLAGIAGIQAQNATGGGVNVLGSRLSVEGFWEYFFVAFAIKSSLGLLALLAVATFLLARRAARLDATLLLLLTLPLFLFLQGMSSSYNIGIRHMAPAYPIFVIVATVVVVRALPRVPASLLLGALALVQLVETARVHPFEVSFFNALIGGPKNGIRWLSDSNLDWGQDLERLGTELRRRGVEGRTTVAYFGGGYPPLECPSSRFYDPAGTELSPGLYAVSAFILVVAPELQAFRGDTVGSQGFDRLRRALKSRGRLVSRVGYSILLFELSAEGKT